MKILLRILLFILVLCLLAGLAGSLALVTTIPWLSDFVTGLVGRYSWLPLALGAVLLFFAAASVLALVLIVSVPMKKNLFVLHKAGGDIEITRQSVESEANQALGAMSELKRFHVEAKGSMRPGRLKLAVQAEPRDPQADLARLGEAIQRHLSQVMAECLAISPRHVKVRLQAVAPAGEGRHHHAKVPRVV